MDTGMIIYILVGLAIVGFVVYKLVTAKRNRRLKLLARVRGAYGVLPNREYSDTEMKKIRAYFDAVSRPGEYKVDDITWNDLDMDSVFIAMNHTHSSVGEERLYDLLRHPSFDPEDGGYVNDAQKNYIREYIQKAEDAIYEGGDYGAYLDLQSLADYWWIMEFTGNEDAFRTDSAHMFKPRYEADGSEGKLHFGPVWDFDASTGNGQKETGVQKGFNNTTFIWVDELRKNPEFLEYMKQRWQVMDAKLAGMTADGGAIDRMAAIVQASWGRDDAKWHSFKEERDMLPTRNFEEEITHMKQWIDLRRGWINENLDKLGQLTYVLTVRGEGMEERTYDIACDTMVDVYMLDTPEVEGKTFTDWTDESGAVVDFIEMDADRTLTAQFE